MALAWSFVDGAGQQHGPVVEQELASMLQRSEVPMEALVWKVGMEEWRPAKDVDEFRGIQPVERPPAEHDPVWYYLTEAQERVGPVSGMVLARMVTVGKLDGMALIWCPQFGESWKAVGDVAEIKALIRRLQSATSEKPDASAGADAGRFVALNGKALVFDEASREWVPEGKARSRSGPGQRAGRGAGAGAAPGNGEDEKGGAAPERKRARRKKSAAQRRVAYVSGLPRDMTEREFADLFSKYGVLQVDLETGDPRIKLYRDESGGMKGDGTVAFLREESVTLAIEMADGMAVRGSTLRVEPAKFAQKAAGGKGGAGAAKGDAAAPKAKRRAKPLSHQAKMRAKAREQLLSWNEGVDEDSPKIVVVHHMFNPEEFQQPGFEDQLRVDIDQGFGVYGEMEKVTLFEKNPLGVLVIKYKEPFAAEQCVRHTEGRWYGGRQLRCKYWDGSDYSVPDEAEEEEEEVKDKKDQERIHSFGDWLEGVSSDSEDDVVAE